MQVQSKRSYSEVERRSRYQDELDIGAGTNIQGRVIVVGTHFEVARQGVQYKAKRLLWTRVSRAPGRGVQYKAMTSLWLQTLRVTGRGAHYKAMTSSWARTLRAAGGGQLAIRAQALAPAAGRPM